MTSEATLHLLDLCGTPAPVPLQNAVSRLVVKGECWDGPAGRTAPPAGGAKGRGGATVPTVPPPRRPPAAPRLRHATASDVPQVADVYLRSRAASVPAIPPGVHDDQDVRRWLATTVFPDTQRLDDHELWVGATRAGAVVAFMALAGDWIGHLYVTPGHTGKGIGTAMVTLAKAQRPGGLQLWTFESNAGARRFYERHGFVAVGLTDGDNEEGAPDVHYQWRP